MLEIPWIQELATRDTEKHVLFGAANQIKNGTRFGGKPETEGGIMGKMIRWVFMTLVVAGIAIVFGFVGIAVVTVGIGKTLIFLTLGTGLISIAGRLASRTL